MSKASFKNLPWWVAGPPWVEKEGLKMFPLGKKIQFVHAQLNQWHFCYIFHIKLQTLHAELQPLGIEKYRI